MTGLFYDVLPAVLFPIFIFGIVGLVREKKIKATYRKVFNKLLSLLFVMAVGGGVLLCATFRFRQVCIGIFLLYVAFLLFRLAKHRCPDNLLSGLLWNILISGCNSATTVLFVFSPFLWTINVYSLIVLGNML